MGEAVTQHACRLSPKAAARARKPSYVLGLVCQAGYERIGFLGGMGLSRRWVPRGTRDEIVEFVSRWPEKTAAT